MEMWKYICGWENSYQVSNLGKIRSVTRKIKVCDRKRTYYSIRKSIKLKTVCRKKYLLVTLNNKKIRKTKSVHRLVLEAFRGPCPVGFEAIHKDGNSINNYLSNLKWGTHKENMSHKFTHGTMSKKLNKRDILLIKKISKNKSQKEISIIFGVNQSTISRIVNKRTWSHVK